MLKAVFRKTKKQFNEAKESNDSKLMLWVYYAGHGVMCNMNFIVLNERKNKDRYFNLEGETWNLCEYNKNTCGVIVFDSCREAIT